jgi:hypothetical protein
LQQLARLLYGLKAEREEARAAPTLYGDGLPHSVPEVLLCDGDTVASGNLRRQYFLPKDVNKKKALVLAERYGAAYGLAISAYPEYLMPSTDFRALVTEGSLVVGCVDNAATRRLLHVMWTILPDCPVLVRKLTRHSLPHQGVRPAP